MRNADDLARENEALRDRLSRLSEASLRINQSLDLDTVLQGVLDSARSLTGARYGVLTLLDDSGEVRDFLSSGMTAEEAGQLWELPGGTLLFEYLNGISEPLRLPDLLGHIRSLGLPEFRPPLALGPVVSFLAAPVLHRGERAGNVYVAEKEAGVAFTREDEETLVMFASQAALVIANARTHREEQRARTDLETLINTSPVGVAVFDARTGAPVSFNREARRIVDGLREPDQSPEQLLEVLTVRRADGREVSLMELPLAQALNTGETVRAEEIVLRVPDGRSVTTLINATPIRPEGGEIESYVVTLQDLTALEELGRLRAEFLAMVSHELRTPLTSVKGAVTSLLDPAAGLNPIEMGQFFRIIDAQADRMRRMISDLLDVARIETGDLAVSPEPAEVALLVSEAANAFRSGGGRHGIDIDLAPELPWVMADRLRLVQVLGNLLANAARNSAESSPIRVSAVAEGFQVAVSVSDQGRGIPAESLPRLFRKFSRLEGDEPRGETGLGLAICKGIVEAHGGRIRAESGGPGLGARFTFTVPMVEQAGFVSPSGLPRGFTRSPAPSTGCRTGAGAGGGRRSPGAPVRPRRPHRGGVHAGGHRGPGGGAAAHGPGEAPSGPSGPGAAGDRRSGADAGPAGNCQRAGDLPVSLRPGGPDRPGLRHGGGGLRGQALRAHGAGGPDPGRPAPGDGAGTVGALRAGRPGRQLR